MSASVREKPQSGAPRPAEPLFRSFFMGGFECSTHQLATGRRLDLVHSTQHDRFCELDYRRMVNLGLKVAREGLRWHLIERRAGQYDFSTVDPIVQAAKATGVQVIWDLCHYGWPDDIDIYKPEFVRRFARMAKAFAQWFSNETDDLPVITPINEISFFAWAGGETGYMNPYCKGRSFELKVQLARAAIEGMEAIWSVVPNARFTIVDPIVHVIPHPNRPEDNAAAAAHRAAQFQGWDLLAGRLWPQIGGDEKYLDLIGINYYPDNQWIKGFGLITREHPLYLPFSELICEIYQRYQRPLFIAETGAENRKRPEWLNYICNEVRTAMCRGVELKGICLYPILNHPGWDNDRHCHNGLWDYADDKGEREIYEPLAQEIKKQRDEFESESTRTQTRVALDEAFATQTSGAIPVMNLPKIASSRPRMG